MEWKEIEISTTYQAFSAISNILEELKVEGVCKEELRDNQNELIIKAYFEADNTLRDKLSLLKERIFKLKEYDLEVGSGKIRMNDLDEEDWSNKWKEDFKPVRITDKIIIKPTWEDYEAKKEETIIELDPGQAFGTGYHGTTSACLEALENYLEPNSSFLDIGTGTGILSITAAKLGANPIFALDIDPIAVEVAKENANLNQVEDEIEFVEGDLLDVVDRKYNLVVANILPHIIVKLIPDLPKVVEEEGYFILSGIIEEKTSQVKEALSKYNLQIKEILQKDQWVTIIGIRRG